MNQHPFILNKKERSAYSPLYLTLWATLVCAPWLSALLSPPRLAPIISRDEPSRLCSDSVKEDRYKLSVVGDTRADRSGLGPSARWPSIAWSIMVACPSALLHLGDWVKHGEDAQEWARVRESLRRLTGLPILTIKGNHDRGGFEQFFYADRYQVIRVEEHGPFIIYLVDSEASESSVREALGRLLKERGKSKHSQRTRAKIWAQHRPVWSSGHHGVDERGWRQWLVPALETLEIDLMLSGHDHQYERFCASLGVDEERRCDPLGITYVISGGGASVTVPLPGLSWRQSSSHREQNEKQRMMFSDKAHHLELMIEESDLLLEVWASSHLGDRSLIDQHRIPLK